MSSHLIEMDGWRSMTVFIREQIRLVQFSKRP
jgi:hypothetical protein